MQILTYTTISRKVFDIVGKLLESLESGNITNIIDEVREFNEHFEPWGSKPIKIEQTDPRYALALRRMGGWEGASQGREDLQQSQEASQELREGEEAVAKEEIPAEVFGSIKDKMVNSIPQQHATEQARINNTTDFYSILVPYEVVSLHLFYLSRVRERGIMTPEQARFDSALKTRDISVLQMNLNEISSELIAFLKNFQFENEETGSLDYGNTSAIVNVLESADPKSQGYDLLKKISENRRLTNLSTLLNAYVKQLENNLWSGWNEKIPDAQLSHLSLPQSGTFGDLLLQGAKALQQLKTVHPSLPRFSGGYIIPEGSSERQILNIVVKDIMNVLIKNMLFVIHDFYNIDNGLKSRGIDLDEQEFEALKLDTVGHMVFYAAVSTNYQGVSLHYEETPQELIKFVEVEKTEVTSRQVSDEIKRGNLLKKREETGVEGQFGGFGVFIDLIESMISRVEYVNLRSYDLVADLMGVEVEMTEVEEHEATPQQQKKAEMRAKPVLLPSDLATDVAPAPAPAPAPASPGVAAAMPAVATSSPPPSAVSRKPSGIKRVATEQSGRDAYTRATRSPTATVTADGYGSYGDEYGSYGDGSPRYGRENSYDYGPQKSPSVKPQSPVASPKGGPGPATPKPQTPAPPSGELSDDELDAMKKADLMKMLKEKGFNVEDEKKITCADAVYALKPSYAGKKYKSKKGKTTTIFMKGGRKRRNRTRKNKKRKTRRR